MPSRAASMQMQTQPSNIGHPIGPHFQFDQSFILYPEYNPALLKYLGRTSTTTALSQPNNQQQDVKK